MTETDKAREWLDSQHLEENLRSTTTNWYGPMSANNLAKLLAAYGTAQYEAGAASMRERAVKWAQETDLPLPIEAFMGTMKALSAKVCLAMADAVRALPLREKD